MMLQTDTPNRIGSWCGNKLRPDQLIQRCGRDGIAAVQNDQLHEIRSRDILQPGPAALTDGVRQIHGLIQQWAQTC